MSADYPHIKSILAANLLQFRLLRDMEQVQFAKLTGLKHHEVQAIETGKRELSAIELYRIAAVLRMPMSGFLNSQYLVETAERFSSVDRTILTVFRHLQSHPVEVREAVCELVPSIIQTMAGLHSVCCPKQTA